MWVALALLVITSSILLALVIGLKLSIKQLALFYKKEQDLLKEELQMKFDALNTGFANQSQLSLSAQKNYLELLARQMSDATKINELKFDSIRQTLGDNLNKMQLSNDQKLEKMRETVEEKLQSTLEKRLGDSFKLVSERLEIVHRGLGEMQSIASGVGDLKRVLSNIKVRGIWGEVQLDMLIADILIPEQYDKNVQVDPESSCRVEYAVKLPGKDRDKTVWLPIDAKFPFEDFQKLIDIQETADQDQINQQYKLVENSIKACAKMISEKYISPPFTTDFAIMFLPIESIYAEVLRRPGLLELLQREYRVVVTSPTTLAAILNSLQMGFKTLAIEKHSSEVWKVLGAVKTEFLKFADILNKTKIKLDQASKVISDAEVKTRSIQRKLRDVEVDSTNVNQLQIYEDP